MAVVCETKRYLLYVLQRCMVQVLQVTIVNPETEYQKIINGHVDNHPGGTIICTNVPTLHVLSRFIKSKFIMEIAMHGKVC